MNNKKNNEPIKGIWWKINNNIKQKIIAKYDRIKDWEMDPKGYFLIKVDRENNIIKVGYCVFSKLGKNPVHNMIAEIAGKTSIEIVNTIISKGFISTLQHAADMGIELQKAELALKYDFEYTQDKELKINSIT